MIKTENGLGRYVLGCLFVLIILTGCSTGKHPTLPPSTLIPTSESTSVFKATLEAVHLTQTADTGPVALPKLSTRAPTPTPTVTYTPTPSPTPTVAPVTLKPSNPQNNLTLLENIKPGASDWQVNNGFTLNVANSQIAGFADASSVNVGENIHFAISTRVTDTLYSLTVYRMGWYDTSGARMVHQKSGLKGDPQGYWDPNTLGVMSCSTCEIDPQTGLVDTHWTYNYTLTVPSNWVSGLYLVKLVDEKNNTAYIPFVVRDDNRQSDILVQIPFNTYQANNQWGGNSLFKHDSDQPSDVYGTGPAVVVSFNRPYNALGPTTLFADLQLIHFLERHGYDVTYTTSVDIDRDPSMLLRHRALLDAGQDLLWTKAMRDGVEIARDAGIHLAFFGGNSAYYQTRLEPDKNGQARRLLVLYHSVREDPLYTTNPANLTGLYNNAPINRPQNALLGLLLTGSIGSSSNAAWVVGKDMPPALLANTSLKPGDVVKDLAGTQCNAPGANNAQPQNVVFLGVVTFYNPDGKLITCNTTWYQANSGAYVFYAGSTNWLESLDPYFHRNRRLGLDPDIVTLTENLLASFGIKLVVP